MTIEVIKDIELKKYCQYCRSHTNKPSYCKLKNEYVSRKKTCEAFKRYKVNNLAQSTRFSRRNKLI